jgi:adenylate kinase
MKNEVEKVKISRNFSKKSKESSKSIFYVSQERYLVRIRFLGKDSFHFNERETFLQESLKYSYLLSFLEEICYFDPFYFRNSSFNAFSLFKRCYRLALRAVKKTIMGGCAPLLKGSLGGRCRKIMNIIIFGPNGSGKGTQGAVIKEKFHLPHIETGVLFREHKKKKTPLGQEIASYMDKGALVPDELTIRILWDRLDQPDCQKGWLLDGFPRNVSQAENLWNALQTKKLKIHYLVEIKLDRETAKARLMGRRSCPQHPNLPNNIHIPEIQPPQDNEGRYLCRECGTLLEVRADDVDEQAINKRHDIYYDTHEGTCAAIAWLKNKLKTHCVMIELDGKPSVSEVTRHLESALQKSKR